MRRSRGPPDEGGSKVPGATKLDATGPDQQAALLQAAGEMAMQAGRFEEAIGLLDAAASYATAGREREAALLAYPMAMTLIRRGQAEEAAASSSFAA